MKSGFFDSTKGSDKATNPDSAELCAEIPENSIPGLPENSTIGTSSISTTQELVRSEPQLKASCDLYRLARFGANIADAHSCFILLPAEVLGEITCSPSLSQSEGGKTLVLAGYHSLSSDVVRDSRVSRGNGLIGWVANHGRSIHVSPFEQDSRTLGVYSTDQQLKSFLGVPVSIDSRHGSATGHGVIACDSRKSFAFSKVQAKLLEDLSREVANTLELLSLYSAQGQADVAWQTFLRRSNELASALGGSSVEVLRLKLTNEAQLESSLGTTGLLSLSEQLYRLIQQALPPHFPVVRLMNGDIVICLDNMMTSFYENKIRAICEHIAPAGRRPLYHYVKAPARDSRGTRKQRSIDIESMVTSTAAQDGAGEPIPLVREVANEYRRA